MRSFNSPNFAIFIGADGSAVAAVEFLSSSRKRLGSVTGTSRVSHGMISRVAGGGSGLTVIRIGAGAGDGSRFASGVSACTGAGSASTRVSGAGSGSATASRAGAGAAAACVAGARSAPPGVATGSRSTAASIACAGSRSAASCITRVISAALLRRAVLFGCRRIWRGRGCRLRWWRGILLLRSYECRSRKQNEKHGQLDEKLSDWAGGIHRHLLKVFIANYSPGPFTLERTIFR